jgi:peptidoglycan/xylan/chitin deacetylase (PgdA/CDA1 family)
MYHSVGRPGERATLYRVPGRRFARQLRYLRWCRYHVVGLAEFLRNRREHRLPPGHSVIITLDDGYLDNFEVAYPLLRRRGFAATIFVATGLLGYGRRRDEPGELDGREMLTWEAVRDMAANGMEIASHTRSHPDLSKLGDAEILAELHGARRDLARELGSVHPGFAYPYGEFDETVSAFGRAGWPRRGVHGAVRCRATQLSAVRAQAGDHRGHGWARPLQPRTLVREVKQRVVRALRDPTEDALRAVQRGS